MNGHAFFPSFHWSVCGYGYKWITAKAKDEPEMRWLQECLPTGGQLMRVPQYDLKDFPTLFHIFAETPPTEEGILGFANTYGMLGIKELAWFSEEDKKARAEKARRIRQEHGIRGGIILGLDNEHIWGERFTAWQYEISIMDRALKIWKAIQAGDVQWFIDNMILEIMLDEERKTAKAEYSLMDKELFLIHEELRASARGVMTFPSVPDTTKDVEREDLERMINLNEVIPKAWHLIEGLINKQLQAETASQLFYVSGEGRLRLHVVPKNLLGALWLQFARGVDGNKTYVACRGGCGTILEIDALGTGHRTNRLYCSDACRSKAYRERQLRAHQLAAHGMAVEAIAHTLDTELETVLGWLAKMPPSLETRRRGRPRKQLTSNK